MDKFITRENVAHYTKQLLIEIAPIKREMLQKLLAEEMVKQASQIKPRDEYTTSVSGLRKRLQAPPGSHRQGSRCPAGSGRLGHTK